MELVPAEEIEKIAGAKRRKTFHIANAKSAEQAVYILHSQDCLDSHVDLRSCDYSEALHRGIDPSRWPEDTPVICVIEAGRLVPTTPVIAP